MDVYLISRLPKSAVDRHITQLEARGSTFLGSHYEVSVRDVIRTQSIDTVIAIARNRHNPLPEMYFRDSSITYVFSGYLVDDVGSIGKPGRYFGDPDSDRRPIVDSPGGIYSYSTIRHRDGQVCAGHSIPTLEPVYYSEGDSKLHVGNHPLLVHVAARGFDTPAIDHGFYLRAINASVAIDDSTPFIGCYRVPPGSVLVGHPTSAGCEVESVPRPRFGRRRYSTYRQRRDAIVGELTRSGSVLGRLPQGELRVSGGKDSRLVAAFLKHEGIQVVPINQNFPQEVEGQVADLVARTLGAESCIRSPIQSLHSPEAIEEGTLRKIAFGAGLPPVAALQYPIRSEGSKPGIPLIMGHAHLHRGGLNQRIRTTDQALNAAASRTVSPYLQPAYSEPNVRIVRRFVNETLGRGVYAQSISFHAYLHFVMSYQFQSLYTYVRNWNPLITPLVEERFSLLCEAIADSAPPKRRTGEFAGITDLRNERLAMGATEWLAPELLEFPLSNDRYRCDGPDRKDFDLRDPALLTPQPVPEDHLRQVFNVRRLSVNTRSHFWELIEASVVASFGQLTCRPAIWRYVSEPSSPAPEDENITLLNQFVWHLYGLALILDREWWRVLAR